MNNWETIKISEIISFSNGKGIKRNDFKKNGNYPVMGANGIIGYTDKYLEENPVTVIGRVGSSGEINRSNGPAWIGDNAIIAKSKKNSDDIFNYYLLKSLNFKGIITGSTQPLLTQSAISQLEVLVPNKIDQKKKIGSFLKKFDDKINLNSLINDKILQLINKIFFSWFINFDLTKLKKKKLKKKFSIEFEDLFPSDFEETEFGKIPKGWKLGTLGELISRSKYKTNKSSFKIFSASNTGELVLSDEYFSKKVYSKDTSKYLKVEKFDFAYNPSRINIGSIGMNKFNFTGAVSPVYVVFSAQKNWNWFLERYLNLNSTKKQISQLCSGSVRQSLSFEDFASIKIVIPNKKVIEKFNEIFLSLNNMLTNNNEINKNFYNFQKILGQKIFSGRINLN